MAFEALRAITIKMWGGYDTLRMVYVLFIFGIALPLKRTYFGPSFRNTALFKTWKCLVSIIYVVVTFNMISDGIRVMDDLSKLTYSLSTSMLLFGSILHYISLIMQKKELETCLDQVSNNFYLPGIGDTDADAAILQKGEERLRFLIKAYAVYAVMGVVARLVYHLTPPEQMMLLPFPFSDYLQSPFFGIMFFFQCIGLILFLITLLSSQMIFLGFLIKISDHFDILNKNISQLSFEDADPGDDAFALLMSTNNTPYQVKRRLEMLTKTRKEKAQELIKNGIIHHQNILSAIRRMNGVVGGTLFLQLVLCSLLVAVLFGDLIWKSSSLGLKAVAQCTFAAAFFFNASVVCFYGSKIEIKSHQAANTLYMSSWLEMDVENRKICLFFLTALWRQPVVKAGGIFPANLKFLVDFVYLAYDCITFMIKTVDRIST